MNFRKWTLLAVSPLLLGLAFAQEPPRQEPQPPPAPAKSQPPAAADQQPVPPAAAAEPQTTGTKEVPSEVVATDADAKTIRVKVMVKKDPAAEPTMQEGTLPVDAEALVALATVKPGDKVKLTCRMNGDKVIAVKAIKQDDGKKKETTEKS
jgi:Cu/Ag efflux protein CusF